METLLLSLHPRHAQNILSGKKTIELRKQDPREHSRILIYETLPVAAIVGYCESLKILCLFTSEWVKSKDELCLTSAEIKKYLGDRMGYGIKLRNPQRISPIPLSKMREARILPPQGYRYLQDADLEKLGIKF